MKNETKKTIIILSGGVDSTTLLYDLLSQDYEVYALGFNYGQQHSKELQYASKTCKKLSINYKILEMMKIKEVMFSTLNTVNGEIPEGSYEEEIMKQTVVPNRNMVMLSIATAYACSIKAEAVYYGAHVGDHHIYPDCRPIFVERMRAVIEVCDYHKPELRVPYLFMTKGDIVKKGIELNVDYSLTWTCYKGKELACGKCGSCVERLEAFEKNNVKDPIKYDI